MILSFLSVQGYACCFSNFKNTLYPLLVCFRIIVTFILIYLIICVVQILELFVPVLIFVNLCKSFLALTSNTADVKIQRTQLLGVFYTLWSNSKYVAVVVASLFLFYAPLCDHYNLWFLNNSRRILCILINSFRVNFSYLVMSVA